MGTKKATEVFNVWYVVDIVNYACYISFIYYRVQVINKSVCNPVFVPANSYLTIFEEIFVIQQQQLTINFISILIGIGRFFKYYQFQPRLQIVNLTLSSSAIHLVHFSVVFMVMLCGFALIGHLNFGAQIRDFSTWSNALQVMWESLFGAYDLGPIIGNSSISYVDPMIANLFFYIWTFLTGMILMNIFVSERVCVCVCAYVYLCICVFERGCVFMHSHLNVRVYIGGYSDGWLCRGC